MYLQAGAADGTNKGSFRITGINGSPATEVRIDADSVNVNGNEVYHSGNFDPSAKVDSDFPTIRSGYFAIRPYGANHIGDLNGKLESYVTETVTPAPLWTLYYKNSANSVVPLNLRINGEFYSGNNKVWHEGTFDPSTKANSNHTHDRLEITDTRGASRPPSFYDPRSAQWDFQSNADTGAAGDNWTALLTVYPWGNFNTSHRQQQLAFTGTGGLKFRFATSDTEWDNWQTVFTSGNQLDIGTDAASARSVLGLGSAATLNASASHQGSTVVQRNSAGDVFARLFRSEYDSHDGKSTINYIMTQRALGVDADNYLRPAHVSTIADVLADKFTSDILISKNNAWLTLDSPSTGNNGIEQAAGISVGENGYKGSASLHITYTGDGTGWIGMGAVDPETSIPTHAAIKLRYTNSNVELLGTLTTASSITSGSGITSANYFYANGNRFYFNATGDGHIVGSGAHGITIRPQGWSVTNQAYFSNDGVMQYNGSRIEIGSGTTQTQISSSGIFARAGGPVYLRPNGYLSTTGQVMVGTNGAVSAYDFATSSDRRMKKHVRRREPNRNLPESIRLFDFVWRDTGTASISVIAQQVLKVAPEYVRQNEETGMYAVDKIGLALECIAALTQRVKELEEHNSDNQN